MKKTIKRYEFAILSITAILSVVIAILDISGAADKIKWISEKIPSLILLCVAFIASYLILERRLHIEKIAADISKLLQVAEVEKFPSHIEARKFALNAFRSAQKGVDQVSLDMMSKSYIRNRSEYDNARFRLIKEDRIRYRYVAMLYDQRRFKMVKELLQNKELNNFFAGFYVGANDALSGGLLPLSSFMIFDEKELMLIYPFEHGEDSAYLLVKSPEIVNFFKRYFEKLWANSFKIETAADIDFVESHIPIYTQEIANK